MTELGLAGVVGLPIVLGLFGFVEPCTIGSTLIMVKQLEGQPREARIVQVLAFAGARAVFIGALGAVAAAVGSVFLGHRLRRARGVLDRLAALSGRVPRWCGVLFVLLGLWSIWFGLFVSIAP